MRDQAAGALARRGAQADCHATAIGALRPSAPFDHLLLAHVIEHVPDPVAALRHLRGLVTPDGRLWLVVSKPHWCNAIIWLHWRHRACRAAEIAECLAAAGWHLEATRAFPSGPPSRTSQGYSARPA